jgi:hypothetical protein
MDKYSISPARVAIYEHGIKLTRDRVRLLNQSNQSSKRGKISSFSLKSSARLRNVFLTHDIPDSSKVGWTLTLPWQDDLFDGEDAPGWELFRALLNKVQIYYKRNAPRSGYIFRVELQKRGVPHLHAIEYCAPGTEPKLGKVWFKLVVDHLSTPTDRLDAFYKYGVKRDGLHPKDNTGYFRYLTDHASKHKQTQLGYKGRQWGIVNRSAFVVEQGMTYGLEPDEYRLLVRYFQRFNRYPVTKRLSDGTRMVVKYRRNRRSVGASFLRGGSETAEKLVALARSNAGWPIADTGRHAAQIKR